MFIRVEFNADSQEDFIKLAEIMKVMGGSPNVEMVRAEPEKATKPGKSATKGNEKEAEKPVVAATVTATPVEEPIETVEEPVVELEVEDAPVTGQVVTHEMVRKIATELIQKNKTKEVNAIINKYAPKISELTDLQYVTVYNQLKAL